MRIDNILFYAFPKVLRVKEFTTLAQAFLKTSQSFKTLEVLLGLMASLLDLVLDGRLRMRPLQFAPNLARRDGVPDHQFLPLQPGCPSAIKWWLSGHRLLLGASIAFPHASISMETDASTVGWGCGINHSLSRGLWSSEES